MRMPDDWHCHFREPGDPRFAPTVAYIARQFARATAIGNTVPPILTAKQMIRYRDEIRRAAQAAGFQEFEPMMVLMASPDTMPDMVRDAFLAGAYGVKTMPAHGTTNSAHGIYDYSHPLFIDGLRTVRDHGLAALFHAEVPDGRIPLVRREREFIPILDRIRERIPDLKICVEHISDAQMVQWVMDQGDLVAATVTPHHMYVTALQADRDPHLQCMPYPKSVEDVLAVRKAALWHPRFFFGSDNAPHLRPTKERTVPPPTFGVFTAPVEVAAVVEMFEEDHELPAVEGFLSERGARWHDLPLNEGEIELVWLPWNVPQVIDLGGGNEIVPYLHGRTLQWQLAK